VSSAASKVVREKPGTYDTNDRKSPAHDRVSKKVDKTIDRVVRDYGEALRRLEDF
jgi:hypothetical protein